MKVNNFKELEKYLMKLAGDILKDDVAEAVKSVQVAKIQTEVYDKYTPFQYKRRGADGGLQDRDNMIVSDPKVTSNSATIEIENQASGEDGKFRRLPYLIEYGHGYEGMFYDFPFNRDGTEDNFLKPRPFIGPTVEALKRTKDHVKAMKAGLKKRGLDVV